MIEVAVKTPRTGTRAEVEGIRADGDHFPTEVTVARVEGPDPLAMGFLRDLSESATEIADLRRDDDRARQRGAAKRADRGDRDRDR